MREHDHDKYQELADAAFRDTCNDGGPAFPLSGDGPNAPYHNEGMSLRDYFAGQALIALHASEQRGGRWGDDSARHCATNAYKLADAMLAAREVRP